MLKDRTILNSEEITASDEGVLEFSHVRNCEMIEILYGDEVVASLDTETEYVNGVAITESPMSYQIYQRDENDQAAVTIKGTVSDASEVSININGDTERADIEDNEFTYTKVLDAGLYDITVNSDIGEVAAYTQVGVGDIWVGAGQSNMTDMGAVTDGFEPDTDDPINENMHIIYAEDCTWHQMEHPAGEGRFFKSGIRTSPVTSFAREIAESEGVPVGIVQSSVGGTNIYQWVEGVRDSDPNVVYGDTSVSYRQAQIDTAKVTGSNETTLTFKDTDGLEIAQGIKRIGITNVSGGGVKIELGDLKKEFVVRKGASRYVTASNKDKGTEMTITNAEIKDGNKVVLTTEEELNGIIAVDCMYGKRFSPSLVDASTGESVLSFYNVIAEYENKIPVTDAVEIEAADTADLNNVTKTASDSTMYVNYFKTSSADKTSYGLIKFNLGDMDFSKIASAKLAVYSQSIGKDRTGDITIHQ